MFAVSDLLYSVYFTLFSVSRLHQFIIPGSRRLVYSYTFGILYVVALSKVTLYH